MNRSAYTVDLLDKSPITQIQETGFWSENQEKLPKKGFDLFHMAKVAGLAFSLAVSPVTAMSDPWLLDKRRRDSAITVSIYQPAIGRFISRSEALRICRQILHKAERERLNFADFEAVRGIQWENLP